MDEQEWMRRIDEHLDDIKRGNETARDYMREGHEIMARNERAFLDLQSYLREATNALAMMVAEMRGWREENRAVREESREWRRTLAEKVDRLKPEPPPSPA